MRDNLQNTRHRTKARRGINLVVCSKYDASELSLGLTAGAKD